MCNASAWNQTEQFYSSSNLDYIRFHKQAVKNVTLHNSWLISSIYNPHPCLTLLYLHVTQQLEWKQYDWQLKVSVWCFRRRNTDGFGFLPREPFLAHFLWLTFPGVPYLPSIPPNTSSLQPIQGRSVNTHRRARQTHSHRETSLSSRSQNVLNELYALVLPTFSAALVL